MKILTGDNDLVTRKICRDVGLEVDRIVLGTEIEAMSDEALAAIVERTIRLRQGFAGAEGAGHRGAAQRRATSSAFSATASTTARR